MKTRLLPSALALLVCGTFAIEDRHLQAETPNPARAFADILKPIPQQDFLKLRGNKKDEMAMEMSKTLATNELHKPNTFKIKVTKVETNPYPQQGVTGWKITSDSEEKVKIGSMNIPVFVFLYVLEDTTGVMTKLKRGDTVLATGELNQCSMNMNQQGPMLFLALWMASVKTIAK
jgi:hypothetical protein